MHCRFYEEQYPGKHELVVVEIMSIDQMGAYVKLLEYNNIEGLILATSVSNRRIRNVKQHLKVGTLEVLAVIGVDSKSTQDGDRVFIDLTKRNIQPTDIEDKKIFYDKSKQVHLIMRLTAR